MCKTSIHGRGRASGSEFDATRDRRRTRCVSQSLNTPYARTRATRYGEFQQGTISNDPETGEPRPDEFDLTVVRANAVVPNANWITDYTNRFTDLRADLEADNTAYLIPQFTPHSNAPYGECDCAPRP